MTDPTKLEPKNGDFAAYLDELQRESLRDLNKSTAAAAQKSPGVAPEPIGEPQSTLDRLAEVLRRKAEASRAASTSEKPNLPAPARRANTGSGLLRFVGGTLSFIGVVGAFLMIADGLDEAASPFIFLAIAGVFISKVGKARH